MNVEILQENLVSAVKLVNRFVSNKPSLPILSNIYLEAQETGLLLKASNMETAIDLKIPAKVESGGVFAIPAKLFTEYLQALPAGKLSLSAEKYQLNLLKEGYKATLNGVDPKDFPNISQPDYTHQLTIETSIISEVVKKVLFAASTEEARPVLAALLIKISENNLQVVATDGYRLSLIHGISLKTNIEDVSFLVPAKVLGEVEKIAKETQTSQISVAFATENKTIRFIIGDITVTSRLIDGAYPNYGKIIPENESIQLTVDTSSLSESVKAASLFARHSGQLIKWLINKKQLTISAQAAQVGEQESIISIENSSEKELTVAFNSRYITDVLTHLDTDEIIIGLNGPLQPVSFRVGKQNYIHVIMPVRTQESS